MCSRRPRIPTAQAPPPAPLAPLEGQYAAFTSDAVATGSERAARAGRAQGLQGLFINALQAVTGLPGTTPGSTATVQTGTQTTTNQAPVIGPNGQAVGTAVTGTSTTTGPQLVINGQAPPSTVTQTGAPIQLGGTVRPFGNDKVPVADPSRPQITSRPTDIFRPGANQYNQEREQLIRLPNGTLLPYTAAPTPTRSPFLGRRGAGRK